MRGQLCCNKSQPQVERTQYRISSTKLGTPLYTARACPGSVTDKDTARIPASTRANLWLHRMCTWASVRSAVLRQAAGQGGAHAVQDQQHQAGDGVNLRAGLKS